MFDTLYIGTSGLLSNAKGLKVVSNNLANVNTPGFKGSQLQFSELFEQGGGVANNNEQQHAAGGIGVTSLGAAVNFRAGNDQSTGNPLDLSISGNGMFVVRRDDGELLYTRAGDFQFDADNVLTNGSGQHVQGMDKDGKLIDITLNSLEHSAAKATTTVNFSGNLTSTVATPAVDTTINGVTIIDPSGGSHTLNLSFTDAGNGSYTVKVTDAAAASGAAALGTGTIKYAAGVPVAGSSSVTIQYSTTGVAAFPVTLDFSESSSSSLASDLRFSKQDGYAAGVRTDQAIDADGTISVTYSNGQKGKGTRLALAQFVTQNDLQQVGGGAFTKTANGEVHYGYAASGSYGSLVAGHREGSNVDLAEEFSNLIVMQRGYQAASHVISTTNDMIQELFDMKGHR
ncbi:flagellar basal-body rod protein FlgF [Duganella sp. FT80W]|uniref:Flagellar basal-body rod protein FlgF n=1 Tax=Duganella guangzhouensis TaxID=2666084 RepID=A0A6I2L7P8_9BURK|nr:flagellar basal-body rod protein FlgF [Duganella guangzhouensis]MRW94178.1 flagellar basal-body rod protein FlgF [Duganella guangzhouensis]